MLCYRYYYIYLCNCGHCIVMLTVAECIWCCEIDTTIQKMGQIQAQISCITEHEVFEPVCLNVWVYNCKQDISVIGNIMVHMIFRTNQDMSKYRVLLNSLTVSHYIQVIQIYLLSTVY